MAASPGQAIGRRPILQAMGLIAIGSIGIQTSSAISASLFSTLGPFAVSSLRLLIAAIILLAIVRPKLRGRTRSAWAGVVIYGIAMAAMAAMAAMNIESLCRYRSHPPGGRGNAGIPRPVPRSLAGVQADPRGALRHRRPHRRRAHHGTRWVLRLLGLCFRPRRGRLLRPVYVGAARSGQ